MTASANVRPAACRRRSRSSWTGGWIAPIAARAASSAAAGARSISTSTLRRINLVAATSTSAATKSAAIESPSGNPAEAATSPASTASVPTKSLPKWSAFERSASLPNRRAARNEATVRARSITRTIATTTKTHQAVSMSCSKTPRSRAPASAATATLTSASTVASARAARCSALPWPYWWPRSAGRWATPIAKNVSSAATRSVPEWSASDTSPRLPLAMPVPSFSATRTPAAQIETSAVRRCGVMPRRLVPAAATEAAECQPDQDQDQTQDQAPGDQDHDPDDDEQCADAHTGNYLTGNRTANGLQVAAQRLLALDRLEEGLEVALSERRRSVPLDHLEEERRPVLRRLGEDLQQVAVLVAVGEDPQPLQVVVVLCDLAHAVLDIVVVRLRRIQEEHAAVLQHLDRLHDARGLQRDVLDSRALTELEVLVDLALALALGRLVDRELDLAGTVRHHLAHQRRVLRLDLVVAEVDDVRHPEDALVELDPLVHLPELDVADDVVDRDQADAAAGAAVLRERDVAGEVRPLVVGAIDEAVDVLAVGGDRGQLDPAVLVLHDMRLDNAARSASDGLVEGRRGVWHLQRDVLRRIAVLRREADDRAVGAKPAREHEPDLALLEHVRRAVADTGLRAGVRDAVEAERMLIPEGRLLGVPHPELDVIPAVERHEVGVCHGEILLGRRGCPATAAHPRRSCSGGKESVEERAVPLQRDPQVLRRDVLVVVPLRLEPRTLGRERLGQPLHQLGHERVGLLDRIARVVDEGGLDARPALAEAIAVGSLEERLPVRVHAPVGVCHLGVRLDLLGLADEVGRAGARVLLDVLVLDLGALAHDVTSSRSRPPSSSSPNSDLKCTIAWRSDSVSLSPARRWPSRKF